MKVSQLKWGAFLSYFQMGINVLINLLYTPVMLRLLGQSEYGLYNTVSSTISMLGMLNLGFGSGYIRYYARYKGNNDSNSISKLNGMFLIIFCVIGLIAYICGMYLTFNIELVFKDGLTSSEYSTAKVLMFLLTVNLSLSFPMSVFSNIISAHEKFIFSKLIGMVKSVVSPLITLPLLLMGYRSVAIVLVSVSINLIVDVCNLFYVFKVLKERFIFTGIEKGLFFDLFSFTIFIAINLFVDQVNLNVDKVLLGRYRGTRAVAVYSVGYSLFVLYQSFSVSISGVFTPRVHKIINQALNLQRKQISDLFIKVGRIQYIILALVGSGIVFFGKPFITKFWAGTGYDESYYVALLLIIPGSITLIQNIGIEIQRAENKHRFRSIAYLFMAIINLIISIALCQKYGAVGSAIGTAISLIIANGMIMNIYYHTKCNIDIILFWKNILRLSCGIIIPIFFGCIINIFVDLYSFTNFVCSVAGYILVYCFSMWLIGINEYEKNLFLGPIKRVFTHT